MKTRIFHFKNISLGTLEYRGVGSGGLTRLSVVLLLVFVAVTSHVIRLRHAPQTVSSRFRMSSSKHSRNWNNSRSNCKHYKVQLNLKQKKFIKPT